MFSFSEIIDMAIQIEKNGERIYLAAVEHTDDAGLKELLEWMAQEERHHAKWFEEFKQKSSFLSEKESIKKMSEALVRDYLGEQAFSLRDVDFSRVKDSDELIGIFIEFEEDTLVFYNLLVAFVPDESIKKKIREIIAQEEAHVQKLSELAGIAAE